MKRLHEDFSSEQVEDLAHDLIASGYKEGSDFDILYIEGVGFVVDVVETISENYTVTKLFEKHGVI